MFDFSLIKKDSIIITPLEVKQEIIKEKEKINPFGSASAKEAEL